jgi:hypothetical protein
MRTGIIHLCMHDLHNDAFFDFIKAYRKHCLVLKNDGTPNNPKTCSVALFKLPELAKYETSIKECANNS